MKIVLLIVIFLIIYLFLAWFYGFWPVDCERWREIASRAEFEKTPFIYQNCFR